MFSIGIDIGSTCTKTVVMNESGEMIEMLLQPTGWSSVDTAEQIRKSLESKGICIDDAKIVATGYGRISVPYADRQVTEITCHAKGAYYLNENKDMVVIDIGGQDTKIIKIESGQVKDFIMNDKCSAGTGRFVEIMANTMGLTIDELCELARTGSGVTISSMCTVFAESEVISLIGRGEDRKNIAYAVVSSIASKVASQCSHMDTKNAVVYLTGGLCECEFLKERIEQMIGHELVTNSKARFAGAIGAALIAASKEA